MAMSRPVGLLLVIPLAAALAFSHAGTAQKPDVHRTGDDYAAELPYIPPRDLAESLKSFRLHRGFRIELAAAEPLLASPVALDFDEDGRLYVAEFREFNQGASKRPHGRGRVRLLEDTDDDGVYDQSTTFLGDLDSPTALCCYDGGVFVGAVPNILYAKDTDGDGKADLRRVVFTGFARDVGGEALLNSFRWLFDNRIHVQPSTSGGEVRHPDRKDARPVSVRGQGFCFDPRTEAFEATSGGGQHGMSMDDWGRTFVCTSHDPVFLIMYDGRYLARNPYLDAPSAAIRIAPGGYQTKVSRISPNEPWRVVRTRLRTTGIEQPHPTEGDQPSGYFSAASGVTVYRGDAWPEEYRGNVFVGEVSNNLIYRARLVASGIGLTALRADQGAEFLASTDPWFRPVQMANGPDGALYVLDMYRYLVEATDFMPPGIVKHLDVGAGFDKGRLYRIVPEGFQRPMRLRLGKASTGDLVALLDHPNGWHRDTASRLLYQRQDPRSTAPLKMLAALAKLPQGRMHALYALEGLKALDLATVLVGLRDPDARVREHALRLAEPFESAPEVRARLEQMCDDPDLRVRYQLAFSLGAVRGDLPSRALVKLARRDGGDAWVRLAVLSSASGRAGEVLRLLLADKEFRAAPHGRELLAALAAVIGSANRKDDVAALARAIDALPVGEHALLKEIVRGLVAKLPATGRAQFARLAEGEAGGAILADLLRDARNTATDGNRAVADRVAAVRALGLTSFAANRELFRDLLQVRQPQPVQAAALETLARFDQPGVPALLLEAWPRLSPPQRAGAVEALLSRSAWIAAFLDAVEQGKVGRGDVDPARIQLLRTHADAPLRARAANLFGAAQPTRRPDVVTAFRAALQLRGNPARGKAVFKKECSACHQLEGIGTAIGAELNAIRDKGSEAILLNILDPNREVKPQFLSYILVTSTGRIVTGMITAETANGITIRRVDGSSETVLRIDIDQLRSTGVSFMPEGLEQQIDVPAMADLLAYLNSVK
jgi:putative membrane-bound dehydrogenase-like protein